MAIYRNINYTRRDYECTNIIACESADRVPPEPYWERTEDDAILNGLTMLYMNNGIAYYGHL